MGARSGLSFQHAVTVIRKKKTGYQKSAERGSFRIAMRATSFLAAGPGTADGYEFLHVERASLKPRAGAAALRRSRTLRPCGGFGCGPSPARCSLCVRLHA